MLSKSYAQVKHNMLNTHNALKVLKVLKVLQVLNALKVLNAQMLNALSSYELVLKFFDILNLSTGNFCFK